MMVRRRIAVLRGLALMIALALALTGPAAARRQAAGITGDVSIGRADAPVTLTAYLSPTCPACRQWHDDVLPRLKALYLDTGRARLVFKEAPSHNKVIDAAIFAIARCSTEAAYLQVLDAAFASQIKIEQAARSADRLRAILIRLGGLAGLEGGEVDRCIDDEATRRRISDVRAEAIARGVRATPTLFINDRQIGAADAMDAARLIAIIAAALPAHR